MKTGREGVMAEGTVLVCGDEEGVAVVAAGLLTQMGVRAAADRGRFLVALSGGRTPLGLYRRLAGPGFATPLPWQRTWLFFVDERCVPPDDARSNFGTVASAGLLHRPLAGVERIRGELEPSQAAAAYEERILAVVGDPPVFDVVVLGVGSDGHTASLFPDSPGLGERQRLAIPVCGADGLWRVTLTLPVLWGARQLLFLATGKEKARAVAKVVESLQTAGEALSPAALVARHARRVTFLLDSEAGRELGPTPGVVLQGGP